MSSPITLTYCGVKKTPREWAVHLGLAEGSFYARLTRLRRGEITASTCFTSARVRDFIVEDDHLVQKDVITKKKQSLQSAQYRVLKEVIIPDLKVTIVPGELIVYDKNKDSIQFRGKKHKCYNSLKMLFQDEDYFLKLLGDE